MEPLLSPQPEAFTRRVEIASRVPSATARAVYSTQFANHFMTFSLPFLPQARMAFPPPIL